MPLFTVVTVAYNSEKFLKAAIDSLFAQLYNDWELIIGDDASTDNTWEIISGYSDPRIISYRNPENMGEYANRSKAVKKAKGRYCIFIDGDDVMYPHALSTFAVYTRAFPGAAMFFSREWDPRILCPLKLEPKDIYQFEYLDLGITGGNFSNVLFRTDILLQYPFPKNIRSGDSYIQLAIGRDHEAVVVPSGLTWWRRRSNNATARLFANNRYLAEGITYRLAFLDQGCPLSGREVETARRNIYGTYLRSLFRFLLRGKFSDLLYLVPKVKVPAKYLLTFLRPAQFDHHKMISGDKPLHTSPFFEHSSPDSVS